VGHRWLPENLIAPLEQDSQTTYNFLHCVQAARRGLRSRSARRARMPFSSHYVSIEGRCLMAPEGGYRVFPYAVSRYDQTPARSTAAARP
jgi:hypothetical protein